MLLYDDFVANPRNCIEIVADLVILVCAPRAAYFSSNLVLKLFRSSYFFSVSLLQFLFLPRLFFTIFSANRSF